MFRYCTASVVRLSRGNISGGQKMQGIRAFADAVGGGADESTNAAVSKLKGSVKWFDSKKGFGFIIPEDGSEDVFVHQTSIHAKGFRSLMDGEPVEYDLSNESNRISALNVTGPYGSYVQGKRPPYTQRPGYNDYQRSEGGYDRREGSGFGGSQGNRNEGGFGSSEGGGYGGSSGGQPY